MSSKNKSIPSRDIRVNVRESYGNFAQQFEPRAAGCGCSPAEGSAAAALPESGPVMNLYNSAEFAALPEEVTGLSLGCGDPVTLASLEEGQTVLDLGSGGGIDCFLAARRVGETGRVIGVDMTAAMIEKARANKARVGAENVEFRLGEIEHLPVADESVDIIISNCVINLSPDKPQVFREAFRALKPGGRLAISDIMTDGPLPRAIRDDLDAWAGCIGGALEENEYLGAIRDAGFVDIQLARLYLDASLVDAELEELGLLEQARDGRHAVVKVGSEVRIIELGDSESSTVMPRAFSGKVTARKPIA